MNTRCLMRAMLVGALGLVASVALAIDVPRFYGNSYINLGTPTALQLPAKAPLTFEAWVRVEKLTADAMVFSKSNGRASPYTFMFGLRGSGTKMSAYTGAGGSPANTWRDVALPKPIALGDWHHLAYSYDGTNMAFIFDGVLLGSTAYSYGLYASHDVKIGGYDNGVDLQGNFADVRVWDHARTSERIAENRFRRLLDSETGLLGYWPLDEGTGTQVFDHSGNSATGAFANVSWAVEPSLDLTQFTITHPVTGSTRFTSTNELTVVGISTPDECNAYQITLSEEPAAINPAGWVSASVPPANVTFDWPASDTNITVHAWFTNTVSGSVLYHDQASITYTTVTPDVSVRSTLTRERLPDQTVTINGSYLDNGSTGGTVGETILDVFAYRAVAVNPSDDQTPEAPHVTLSDEGTYPLLLQVMNEAGQVATSIATCQVTVVSYSGTNLWTGKGITDHWNDGGNWNADVPAAGQDVLVASGNLRLTAATAGLASFKMTGGSLIFSDWSSQLNATNATITGGTVTCASDFDESSPSNRVWIVCEESFHLAKPGTINVDGKGYTSDSGPGVGVTAGYGTGGGHGGQGGFAYARGGATYGSLTAPVTPGSGGTPYIAIAALGGSGGGAVRIIAGDTVSIAGAISANGLKPPSSAGGGAGGSIYITAAHFTGNSDGLLAANGGAAGSVSLGGAGGGGRIAVDGGQVAAPLAVRFSTAPGRGDNDAEDTGVPAAIRPLEPHQAWTAGWGTLYIEDESLLSAMPQNNQFNRVVLRVGNATAWNVAQLTLTNNSFRLIPEGFQLNVAGDLKVGANAHLGIEGSIACGGNLVLTNGARLSVFSGPADDGIYGAFVDVTNDIVIAENAWLQPNNNATNGSSVRLRMRNLRIVGTTGGINAMARGYAPRQGPGMGGGINYYGCGGGYGGIGGKTSSGAAGSTYGNPYAPLAPGSGGGGSADGAPLFTGSGYGGGLISIEAAQNVLINGQIIADGGIGTGAYLYGAGGAGGGIFISCDRFFGMETALLSVKGGDCSHGGGGGGGRIAVWHRRMPASLQAQLISGDTGTAISSTNNPADYLGQINVGIGIGSATRELVDAQPGSIWFIMPPPSGTVFILR